MAPACGSAPPLLMPLAFAHLLGLALGGALAWIAAPQLARGDEPVVVSRPFALVAAFVGFVWLPVVGYFAAFHGDWSYLYLVSSGRVPSAVALALVLLSGGCVLAGFCGSVGPVRKRRFAPVLVVITVPSLAALVALPFAVHRLSVSGTYAQFHGDFGTEPIGSGLLGKGVLLMGAALALGVAWTVHSLLRMGADAST